MKKILAGACALALAGLCILGAQTPAARAADAQQCQRYANDAVHANDQNNALGCNLAGPQWQSNFSNHYNWCLGQPDDALSSETHLRDQAIESCGRCVDYAREAVSQNEQNLSRSCGYSGPQWQSDYNAHFGWCLTMSADAVRSERDLRIQALGFCTNK